MPFVPDEAANVPSEPHLGLQVKDGTITAIPKGATMAIIMDPTRVDGVIPLVLLKVTAKALYFRCACGRDGCSLRLTYRASRTGYHPPMKTVE